MVETAPTRHLGAQISHMLKARGVDVIFGIPGVHNIEMYRGVEEAGIIHVLARHEQGAGFMADGYARASGKPGVAYVITGPGLCNIMTPMGQAYSDSVPLLVLSSCLDETVARRGQLHQMIDQAGAAACVCDWSFEARTPGAAFALIDRALTEFVSQRPRPKHLQIPIGLLGADAEACWDDLYLPGYARPLPIPEQVETAAEALKAARRPLFVFGGGACGAVQAARDVLRLSRASSFCTYAGRGIVAADDTLYFGAYLARPDSAAIFAQADLVLQVGTDMAEVDLWRDALGHTCETIHVNLDAEVLARGKGTDQRIHADSLEFLKALGGRLKDHVPQTTWFEEDVAKTRARWRAEVESERPGILPVLDALRDITPPETMIYSDMTQIAYTALETWPMDWPGHWHHPYGFGTLGYAVPAAIGGAVARPGLPTLAIAGDYGFQYTLQELGTAVELGLPLPIVVWDNAKLKEIEDAMVRAQIAPNAVVAQNPDFCALARAYGAHATLPGTLDEMRMAVRAAFEADRPTLIHVRPGLA
ncbi:thiamine pyrophosphate-binding protein [Roseovarius aestuariivivens]|uniref:thiamine pyrophosphate-binding protein n=1 Tax=Roseovarius aestuariivivens TaxID=1888910 RepID=UPI001080C11A|nr:thiamine pyrophosphate-binding protein [Roseovarius aestuariivivens]